MMLSAGFEVKKIITSGATIHLEHGGEGPALLLLHGYPQTHMMWHRVAPQLAKYFHIICPDLRGYGDSSKPISDKDHSPYSKRAMAEDMLEVMEAFGETHFYVAGHDRGGRVAHRMALDAPERVKKLCVLDIVPTDYMFKTTDQRFATGYYHWFFLIQPDGLPEQMIGANPTYYLKEKLKRWAAQGAVFDQEAVDEYLRCFSDPTCIHTSCEDYRAAASIDLLHAEQDRGKNIQCPLLVLWGKQGFVERQYDVMAVWGNYAKGIDGKALDCGHFLAEEEPDAVCENLIQFFTNV